MSEWIRFEDQKPLPHARILVYVPGMKCVAAAIYEGMYSFCGISLVYPCLGAGCYEFISDIEVDYWMPLPELPEE